MVLYRSPRGLYPFQVEHVARVVSRKNNLLAWDTGLGKTHGAMASAAFLFEQGLIDVVLLVAERNKIVEWEEDFSKFTCLSTLKYEGTPKRRLTLLNKIPHVVIATYETSRQDLVVRNRGSKSFSPGPLTEALMGKRVFVAYDEMAKLGNRTSLLHKAHRYAIEQWRNAGDCRVLGMTATPMERNPENFYNIGRILTADTVGTINDFYKEHVVDFDMFGNPSKFRNLPSLASKLSPVLLRKRKTDPDVLDQFPKMIEEFAWVEMSREHRALYESVEKEIQLAEDEMKEKVGFGLLRLIAGHPASILSSEGEMARSVVARVGEQHLLSLGSEKLDALLEYLDGVCLGQGEQAVVFSYYVSLVQLIYTALEQRNISSVMYHGQMSSSAKEQARLAFKSGAASVMICSSAAERGMNLPEASYVVNFDLPTKHTSYLQRLNRISRIGSISNEIVVAKSFIVANSVEEAIAGLWIGRNHQSDVLLDWDVEDDDEAFLSSADRRALLRQSRKQQKG